MSRKALVIAIMIVTAGSLSTPMAFAQGMPPMTHPIVGFVTTEDGLAIAGAEITLELQRTEERLYSASNSEGKYMIDISGLPSGYQVGDSVIVRAVSGGLEGSATVTVTSIAFDMCNVTVSEGNSDPTIPFLLPVAAAIAIVIAVAAALLILRKPAVRGKPSGGKERRRRGR